MATKELRLVLIVKDFDRATAFFRDALGLPQVAAWENDGGRVVLLDAGRATLEIFDEAEARAIDRVEAGRRVAGPVWVAFKWRTAKGRRGSGRRGARIFGGPVLTPGRSQRPRHRSRRHPADPLCVRSVRAMGRPAPSERMGFRTGRPKRPSS